jgi:hypothetical protein
MTNAFAVLGVDRDATAQEIRSAYRTLARELHPDRHVRADGTVPAEAHDAFIALTAAFRTALAARARTPVGGQVPQQRQAPVPTQRRAPRAEQPPRPPIRPPSRPPERPSARQPLREVDPMLAFLTLPQRCLQNWPTDAVASWALVLAPAARAHLEEAERHALAAGATSQPAYVAATQHALLTLTLRRRRRLRGMTAERISAAYTFLESGLPAATVHLLPPRGTLRRWALR